MSGAPLPSRPAADGFRMPGEFEPHAGCWMAWPRRPDNWRDAARPARVAFAAVADAIAAVEPVTVAAHPDDVEGARAALGEGVAVVAIPSDDATNSRDSAHVARVRAALAVSSEGVSRQR